MLGCSCGPRWTVRRQSKKNGDIGDDVSADATEGRDEKNQANEKPQSADRMQQSMDKSQISDKSQACDKQRQSVEMSRLTPGERSALVQRFNRISNGEKFIGKETFTECLGVLALGADKYIADRMFAVFDTNQDGKIDVDEYVANLRILLRGTEQERLAWSFRLADASGSGRMAIGEFRRMILACVRSVNVGLSDPGVREGGSPGSHEGPRRVPFQDPAFSLRRSTSGADLQEVDALFCSLATPRSLNGVIDQQAYICALKTNARLQQMLGTTPSYDQPEYYSGVGSAGGQNANGLRLPNISARSAYSSSSGGTPTGELTRAGNSINPTSGILMESVPLETHVEDTESKPMEGKPMDIKQTDAKATDIKQMDIKHTDSRQLERSVHEQHPQLLEKELSGSEKSLVLPNRRPSRLNRAPSKDRSVTGNGPNETTSPINSGESPSPSHLKSPGEPVSSTGSLKASRSSPAPTATRASQSNSPGTQSISMRSRLPPTKKGHSLFGPRQTRGSTVYFGHENWNMVLSMMVGIRLAVRRADNEPSRPIKDSDFLVKDKYTITPGVANIIDSRVGDNVAFTRFVDYAPAVFQAMRALSGIGSAEYSRSLGYEQLLGNLVRGNLTALAELTSEGKGGAFFYYTADGRFMLKTLTFNEKHVLLRNLLKDYYKHMSTHGDKSLIVKFYGLHSVKARRVSRMPFSDKRGSYSSSETVYFVVMGNVFRSHLDVTTRYDLKGSWVGRSVPASVLQEALVGQSEVALKDNEFISTNESIRASTADCKTFLSELQTDSKFLADHGIIDYSLLIGIVHPGSVEQYTGLKISDVTVCDIQALSGQPVPRCLVDPETKRAMIFGIIDFLTQYDLRKRTEVLIKGLANLGTAGISAANPRFYADRFFKFISSHVNSAPLNSAQQI